MTESFGMSVTVTLHFHLVSRLSLQNGEHSYHSALRALLTNYLRDTQFFTVLCSAVGIMNSRLIHQPAWLIDIKSPRQIYKSALIMEFTTRRLAAIRVILTC